MIGQTIAMAVDAYRELHARKLFWVTLAISLLVVLAFAALGIDERGVSILGFHVESAFVNTQFVPAADFYRSLFKDFGIGFWLTWVAAILALISTAGIFPELITGGSIDLWLSRPISRWRLFLTKFVLGLAFVALQVTVFTTASYFVLGVRGGVWEPSLFLAIPLVTLFFSYLFAICTLFGVLTRSTIAALLLTLLAWTGIGLVNIVEGGLFMARTGFVLELESIAADEQRYAERGEALPETIVKERETATRVLGVVGPIHRTLFALKLVLPKTDETIELLGRTLTDPSGLPDPPPAGGRRGMFGSYRVSDEALTRATMEHLHQRPIWWVLGTSLLFTAATVGLAGWFFCRRDY